MYYTKCQINEWGRGVVRDEGKKESEYGEESKKVMKAKEIGRR